MANNIIPVGVKIENISKLFTAKKGDFLAVNNVSLNIEPGKLITLLGPSGCGKTTMLRMISGFTMPTKGKIYIGDKDVTDLPPNKRDVGMMFQSYALFPHMTVAENVAYGLKIKKTPQQEMEERVNNMLEMMRISDFRDRIPERLSGGQQQRVALARAIITEPQVLLFDEPLSNLDAKMREYMRDEIRKLQQRLGITSIYVTHDQVEAMAISDLIVIMNKGIIEQTGSPLEIYVHPNNKFVADFMGKANFVEGKVTRISGDKVTVDCMGSNMTLNKNPVMSCGIGDIVACMIRPEFLSIDNNGKYSGIVKRSTYLGTHVEYEVEIAGNTLVMIDNQVLDNGIHNVSETIKLSLREQNVGLLPNT